MATAQRVEHPSPEERDARGRDARAKVSRKVHGEWVPAPGRRSPVAVLKEQAESRLAELIPIRHARMTASPFAFYRGAAAVMAEDLSVPPTPGSGSSAAATRTSRTSAGSRRRTGRWSSTSTTSTRRCRVRGSGT